MGGRTTAHEILDPATASWVLAADLPVARNGGTAFALGGFVYHVGGEGPSSGQFSRDVYRYDPARDSWERRADFPESRLWTAVGVSVAGRAFVIGGRHGYTQTYAHVYEYDPVADAWLRRADVPHSVQLPAVLVRDGLVHLFGGEHKNSESHSESLRDLQIYDPATDTWARDVDFMPWLLRVGHALPSCGDGVVLAAGQRWDEGVGGWVSNDTAYHYSFASDAWTEWGSLLTDDGLRLAVWVPLQAIDGVGYSAPGWDGSAHTTRSFSFGLEPREPPSDVGAALRVTKDALTPREVIHLSWETAERLPWERRRSLRGLRSELLAQPLPVLSPDTTEGGFVDASATGSSWYYEVQGVDCFGAVSSDSWPPTFP